MSCRVLYKKYHTALALVDMPCHIIWEPQNFVLTLVQPPKARSSLQVSQRRPGKYGERSLCSYEQRALLNTTRVVFVSKTLSSAHYFCLFVYPTDTHELYNNVFALYKNTKFTFLGLMCLSNAYGV